MIRITVTEIVWTVHALENTINIAKKEMENPEYENLAALLEIKIVNLESLRDKLYDSLMKNSKIIGIDP